MAKFLIPEVSNPEISLHGKGKKGWMVCCASPLSEAEKTLLNKILKAINLDLEEDCYLFILPDHKRIQSSQWIEQYKLTYWLNFGLQPDQLSLHIQNNPYETFQFLKCTFLLAEPLSKTAEDQETESPDFPRV